MKTVWNFAQFSPVGMNIERNGDKEAYESLGACFCYIRRFQVFSVSMYWTCVVILAVTFGKD